MEEGKARRAKSKLGTEFSALTISDSAGIDIEELSEFVHEIAVGTTAKRIAIVAPDYSRLASQSGMIANLFLRHFGDRISAILPALGTHVPMSSTEKQEMFSEFTSTHFIDHDFIGGVRHIGTVPKGEVEAVTGIDDLFDLPFYVNSTLVDDTFDLIVSVGQLLPHEVIGISGGSKNILVGLGGRPTIEVSHYISALWGIERTLGNPDTPLRRLLNRGLEMLLDTSPPILFINTVLNPNRPASKQLVHVGAALVDREQPHDVTFSQAAAVAAEGNVYTLGKKYDEVIAYLEPKVYRSTWIGNKAIYRSRLLIADGARLRILAPGVDRLGEDPSIDSVLRHYGYHGHKSISKMKADGTLNENLAAAAHILHSSTFDRFTVEYAAPKLGQKEVESAGFTYDKSLDETNEEASPDRGSTEPDVLFETDDEGRLHIYHPGVALWKA